MSHIPSRSPLRKNRHLILLSIANAILALPYLFAPRMEFFQLQRSAQTLSRTLLGAIEFIAFVASIFSPGSKNVALFVSTLLVGWLAIWGCQRLWDSGEDGRIVVTIALLFNLAFGATAVWAGALLVESPAFCTSQLDQQRMLRLIEYRGKGWHPDVYYFLAVSEDAGLSWVQASVEVVSSAFEDPCANVRAIFPDLDALLRGVDAG